MQLKIGQAHNLLFQHQPVLHRRPTRIEIKCNFIIMRSHNHIFKASPFHCVLIFQFNMLSSVWINGFRRKWQNDIYSLPKRKQVKRAFAILTNSITIYVYIHTMECKHYRWIYSYIRDKTHLLDIANSISVQGSTVR